jgi:ABC-type transport system involved in multi-copper enzyme maturation permease subunit
MEGETTMFWNLFRIEQTKLLKRAMLWIEIGLLALLVVVFQLMLFVALRSTPASAQFPEEVRAQLQEMVTWPLGLNTVLSFAGGNSLGGLLLVVLVGAITGQEYTWRTLHLWLSHGASRAGLLAAKFVALLLPMALIVLTPVLVGGLLTAYFTVTLNGALNPADVDFGQLALDIARTAYTLLPYAALAFLLAVVTRSTVAAIGGSLAYSMLIEGILMQILQFISGTIAKITIYLPAGLAVGVMGGPAGQVSVNGQTAASLVYLDPGPAALGIALYTILFVGLAMWAFRRQDLTG